MRVEGANDWEAWVADSQGKRDIVVLWEEVMEVVQIGEDREVDCRSEVCIGFILSIDGGVVKRMLGSYRGNRDFYPWLSVWCIVGWFSN